VTDNHKAFAHCKARHPPPPPLPKKKKRALAAIRMNPFFPHLGLILAHRFLENFASTGPWFVSGPPQYGLAGGLVFEFFH